MQHDIQIAATKIATTKIKVTISWKELLNNQAVIISQN